MNFLNIIFQTMGGGGGDDELSKQQQEEEAMRKRQDREVQQMRLNLLRRMRGGSAGDLDNTDSNSTLG